jgi:hypothetical protein
MKNYFQILLRDRYARRLLASKGLVEDFVDWEVERILRRARFRAFLRRWLPWPTLFVVIHEKTVAEKFAEKELEALKDQKTYWNREPVEIVEAERPE